MHLYVRAYRQCNRVAPKREASVTTTPYTLLRVNGFIQLQQNSYVYTSAQYNLAEFKLDCHYNSSAHQIVALAYGSPTAPVDVYCLLDP